jgi:hypothetical protein
VTGTGARSAFAAHIAQEQAAERLRIAVDHQTARSRAIEQWLATCEAEQQSGQSGQTAPISGNTLPT